MIIRGCFSTKNKTPCKDDFGSRKYSSKNGNFTREGREAVIWCSGCIQDSCNSSEMFSNVWLFVILPV